MTKVALVRSDNYGQECKRGMNHLIKLLGDIKRIVHPNDVVLIKPKCARYMIYH